MVVRRAASISRAPLRAAAPDLARRFFEFDALDLRRRAADRWPIDSPTRNARRRARAGCALADVERQRVESVEQVDARRLRQARRSRRARAAAAGSAFAARAAPPARSSPGRDRGRAPGRTPTARARRRARDAARRAAVAWRAITLSRLWPRLVRKQPARKPHRAQHARGEPALEARERVLQESVVEARVVRDEQRAGRARGNLVGDAAERSARRAPSRW